MDRFKKAFAYLLIEILRNYNYNMLSRLRVKLYRVLGASIGNDVKIKSGVIIEFPEKLIIGNSTSIQHNCYISAYGKIIIGSNVSIAHSVSILSSTHEYEGDVIIRETPLKLLNVNIQDNVWIGMKSSIVGVTICSGSVVGANSYVNRDTTENEVVGGSPARHIKYRETK